MYLKNRITFGLLIICACISSCANQSSPTGGPKDEDPPILNSSVPEDKSLNYKARKITLEFDEYVKLNNPKEEIIITPRLLGEYSIKHKKNKVFIELEDSLQSNTTYTFNFREAIQDLNESNTPLDLQIAFSTGSYLDSLSISGNVYDLLSNDPGKNITVSLYNSDDTLTVFDSPPVYFTKTNSSGDFVFNNLKNGSYEIFAINDKNKNLMLESNGESYSYSDSTIQLDSRVTNFNLPLINLDVSPLELQSLKTRGHYFILKYNKYVSSYSQSLLSTEIDLPPSSLSADHREIKYYNSNFLADSLGIIINAYDTTNNLKVDTIYVKFEETKRDRDVFELSYSTISLDKKNPKIDIAINFNKPVQLVNFDSIYFQIDSAKNIFFDTTNFIWNAQYTQLKILKTLSDNLFNVPVPEENSNNTENTIVSEKGSKTSSLDKSKSTANAKKKSNPFLYFGTLAFTSVEQDTSEVHTEKVIFLNPASLATVLVEVETDATSFYTQLINSKGRVTSENYGEKKFSYNNVVPGTYKIRILHDLNDNQKWDFGNISNRTLPEPVIFYTSEEGSTEITLRANWELGPNLIKF